VGVHLVVDDIFGGAHEVGSCARDRTRRVGSMARNMGWEQESVRGFERTTPPWCLLFGDYIIIYIVVILKKHSKTLHKRSLRFPAGRLLVGPLPQDFLQGVHFTGKGSSRKNRVRENGGTERSTALQSKEELNTRSVIPFLLTYDSAYPFYGHLRISFRRY
jgi:hypothetical protein